MTKAQHLDRSVFEMRELYETPRARFSCFMSGAAVMGCLLLGGGVYLGQAYGARAENCPVITGSNTGNAITHTVYGPQQCEAAPDPETFFQSTDSGAQVKTASGKVDVGTTDQGSSDNTPVLRGAGLGKVISTRAHWTNEKGTRTYDWKSTSFFVGGDVAAFSNMRFGALAGYGHSSYEVDAGNTTGASDDFTLGAYGGGAFGGFDVDFGAAYTWRNISSRRDIEFLQLTDRIKGRYDGGAFQLFGGIGYAFDVTETLQFGPFVDGAYIHQKADSFTEMGRFATLSSLKQTMDTGFTTIGLRGAREFALGSYKSQISTSVGWRHSYGDIDSDTMIAFSGGDPFGVTGTPHAADHAVLFLGWETELKDNLSLGITYTGQFGDSARSQNLTGTLSIKF